MHCRFQGRLPRVQPGGAGMKRSEINDIIAKAAKFIWSFGYALPPLHI